MKPSQALHLDGNANGRPVRSNFELFCKSVLAPRRVEPARALLIGWPHDADCDLLIRSFLHGSQVCVPTEEDASRTLAPFDVIIERPDGDVGTFAERFPDRFARLADGGVYVCALPGADGDGERADGSNILSALAFMREFSSYTVAAEHAKKTEATGNGANLASDAWGDRPFASIGEIAEIRCGPDGVAVTRSAGAPALEPGRANGVERSSSTKTEVAHLAQRILDLEAERDRLARRNSRHDDLKAAIHLLQHRLIEARRRPGRMFKLKLQHKLLRSLSKFVAPVAPKASKRLAQSSKKRDPRRDDLNLTGSSYENLVEGWNWLRANNADTLAALKERLSDGHLVSIVVPVFNPEPAHLLEMIRSVRAQSYERWQLCIADDVSNDAIRQTLVDIAATDDRIKLVLREENGHISKATNSALELAEGDWIALLDHDDILDPDALLEMVRVIEERPDVRMIYSDEDIVTADGKPVAPHFKPDWNLDLLYSHNYVTHFLLLRSDLMRKLGGLRIGVEGAQDYDLVLRASELLSPAEIHHIPKVLYHWRASEQSTSGDSGSKPYARDAGLRALQEHLSRVHDREFRVTQAELPFSYRVEWPLDVEPSVSIIIPTRDRLGLTRTAVESILQNTSYSNFEIVIVDNGSVAQETLDWFSAIERDHANLTIMRDERPFNYSALNNAAVSATQGDIVALLNNDVEVINEGWLTEMVSLAVRPGTGCVGAKLYFADGRIQHAGVIVGLGSVAAHGHSQFDGDHSGYFGRLKHRQNYSAVTAACLVVRRDIYKEVGGMNETDLTVAYNDIDFCLKVQQAGYRNVWTPYAELTHYESASRGYETTPTKKKRFEQEKRYLRETWRTQDFRDPAYNPNLTRDRTDFSFAPPSWPL